MNANDSDWLRRALRSRGFFEASFEDAAIHILNTCSVRDKPEHKVYSELGRIRLLAAQRGEKVTAAVGGCVAQQCGKEIMRRFPEVRLVFGSDGIAMAPEALCRIHDAPRLRLSLLDFCEEYAERPLDMGANAPPAAFVSIMQGCDNYCTYCIVPYVRGPQKSRAASAVLQECRELIARGTKEITLLGQNVNSYGQDDQGDGTGFVGLLHRVAELPGLARLRFVTPHPKDIAPEVVAAFADLPQLCPRLHLPLQSGSDRILKKMNRRYDLARYLDIVERLKKARPEIALSTDIIVGFPGETDEDFAQTMRAMREADFAASFSFVYSDRPGVKAALMPDKVERKTALARLAELQSWQNARMERFLKSRVGGQDAVLLESPSRKPSSQGATWQGRDSYGFALNVHTPDADYTGQLLTVKITSSGKHSLTGKIIEPF